VRSKVILEDSICTINFALFHGPVLAEIFWLRLLPVKGISRHLVESEGFFNFSRRASEGKATAHESSPIKEDVGTFWVQAV
jgi:hypothetical protein